MSEPFEGFNRVFLSCDMYWHVLSTAVHSGSGDKAHSISEATDSQVSRSLKATKKIPSVVLSIKNCLCQQSQRESQQMVKVKSEVWVLSYKFMLQGSTGKSAFLFLMMKVFPVSLVRFCIHSECIFKRYWRIHLHSIMGSCYWILSCSSCLVWAECLHPNNATSVRVKSSLPYWWVFFFVLLFNSFYSCIRNWLRWSSLP